MMETVCNRIADLCEYAIARGLAEECDRTYLTNRLAEELQVADPTPDRAPIEAPLEEILGDLCDFTTAAARCLHYGGALYLVYRPDRLETLFSALRMAKFAPKRMLFVQDAPDKAPSMVLCEARLGGNEGLVMLPTLILRESAQNGAPLTPRAQRIYDTGWIE